MKRLTYSYNYVAGKFQGTDDNPIPRLIFRIEKSVYFVTIPECISWNAFLNSPIINVIFAFRMTRNFKRRSERGKTTPDIMHKAITAVLSGSGSIRSVANDYDICHVTLSRYVKKAKGIENNSSITELRVGYQRNRQVFTDTQEAEIEAYIKQAASIFFGLSPKEIRSLAYQYAQTMNISMPSTWAENELAGPDWFTSFMKRHPGLALRTPECTSLARASAFNRENTKLFFTKLSEVLERYNFQAKDIWNVDESGISTVQKPRTIVAPKGTKQVGAITSAERGQTVTLCGAVSAVGTFVPPMFVFPRVHFKDHFIRDGPPGCCGAAHPSGWMVA